MANVTIVNQPAQLQPVNSGSQQAANTPEAGRSSLSQGSVISGTIIGKDAGGNFVLRTATNGNIALRSATPLTYNSDVEVRIGSNTAGGTTARIVSVNGQPFEAGSAAPEPESDSVSDTLLAQASQGTPAASAQTPPTGTQSVRAVVVPAPAPEASAPAASAGAQNNGAQNSGSETGSGTGQNSTGLSAGTAVTLHVETQQSPVATAAETDAAPAPVTTSEQATFTPATTTPQPATSATAQQGLAVPQAAVSAAGTELSGAQVVAQVSEAAAPVSEQASTQPAQQTQQASPVQAAETQAQPQSQSQAPATALYAAYAKQSGGTPAPAAGSSTTQTQMLQAQVASSNDDGTVTLQTPAGQVTVQPEALPPGVTLAPGASLQIEIAAGSGAASPAIASAAPAPLSEIALNWATLKDIIAATTEPAPSDPANPASAQASPVLANLPQIGPSFAASSLSFISSVATGDLRKLLGDDTIDSLQQSGRNDLIEKFSAELGNITQSMTQAASRPMQGWQMIFMPFVYQEAVQQARIYIKRDAPKKEKSSDGAGGDTRFIVEVDLSEMGPMQMDGLVRKQEQSTAFDLVIRSRTVFSDTQKNEISAIYTDAAAMTGFKGGLSFQVTHDFPVKPLDDALLSDLHSITI